MKEEKLLEVSKLFSQLDSEVAAFRNNYERKKYKKFRENRKNILSLQKQISKKLEELK